MNYYTSVTGGPLNNAEVPVSSQWNSGGYYYPTQIAQYGLSHYSKYIAERRRFEEPPGSTTPLTAVFAASNDDARSPMTARGWRWSATTGVVRRVYDAAVQRTVYQFRTPGETDGCILRIKT